ncbi:MAG: radical SAM protein [Thermoanaerobaculaceae bacterium]|jgi:MoaA/NifB/PqqE/SkfB family radical SAM enzyme|nr:radical SAM protein [Thermoanaerobaculaceae bacterium]
MLGRLGRRIRRLLANVATEAGLKGPIRRLVTLVGARTGRPIEFMALDITNTCNLRCPFCFNDFAAVGPRAFMSRQTFEKALALLPLVSGRVFFSCLFEPTIHPAFVDLLEMIPPKLQPKVFFTTNLAAPLDDEALCRLSRLRLAFINVSVDSFDPAVYPVLRRGGQLERYLSNFERLAETLAKAPNPPPLHAVTMALRPNRAEIPRLVERCARDFGVVAHEVRYAYANPFTPPEWKRENLLTSEDWLELQEACRHLPCTLCPPPAGYYAEDHAPYSTPPGEPGHEPPLATCLKVASDGRVELFPAGEFYDLQSLTNSRAFFTDRIARLRAQHT